jgi:hypothetical protein
MLVRTLETTFLPDALRNAAARSGPDHAWRSRCARANAYLADAGLPTTADEASAAAAYVALRTDWDRDIVNLAHAMGYDPSTVDTAGAGFAPHPADAAD